MEDDELLKDLYFNNFLFERSFENKNLFNSTFNILNKLNKLEKNENKENINSSIYTEKNEKMIRKSKKIMK